MLRKTLAQYCPTDSALSKEQKKIESELAAFEKNIRRQARKDSLDSIANADKKNAKGVKGVKKNRRSRTSGSSSTVKTRRQRSRFVRIQYRPGFGSSSASLILGL